MRFMSSDGSATRVRPATGLVAAFAGTTVLAGALLAAAAPGRASLAFTVAALLVAVPSAGLGVVVSHARPGNLTGLWLAVVGWTFAMVTTKEVGNRVLAARPGTADSWAWLVALLAENVWVLFGAVGLLLLYFPDGRLPGPRWRPVPWLVAGCAVVQQVCGAFAPEPFRAPLADLVRPFPPWPGWLAALSAATFVLLLVLLVACAVSVVLRFRRGSPVERRQVKWLALAGFGVPFYPPLCLLEILVLGHPSWFSAAVGVAGVAGLPAATAVAVLRHDLYDIDRAWAVTTTWALVTTAVLGIYAATSAAAGLVLGRRSPAVVAVVTALCAVALAPLRSRLQRAVDARLYPLRPNAFAALDDLHRSTGGGQTAPEELERVLRAALRDPDLRVGYLVPGQAGFVDADGADVPVDGPARTVPVELAGTRIGVLVPGDGPASPDLLREVAGRAGTLVEVVRLRLELGRALREVESSRTRLLQTGYAERRQLERDLHDGAQQRLVSLGMAIRLAQRHLDDGTVDVRGLLDQSVAELGTAVAELRQLARGLRPSSLDDGLPAALAGLVRSSPLTVDMDVCDDALPDDVATTVYFVVSEAIANAVKHARARCIRLRVALDAGHVVVAVTDDGVGGARLDPASGIADRVAALGGRLRVVSPRGAGTTVEAALPCAS